MKKPKLFKPRKKETQAAAKRLVKESIPKWKEKVCKHSTYCDAQCVGHICKENSIRTIDYRSKCVFFEPNKTTADV